MKDTQDSNNSAAGDKKSLKERAFDRMNVRAELDRLEKLIADLKVQYEMHFTGALPLAPDRLHQEVRLFFMKLKKAPFRNSEMNYRLRALDNRFQTFNNYWKRVQREREDGTYARDVFKANLRERVLQEETRAQTAEGKAEKGFQQLFQSYKAALEKASGKEQKLDFGAFQKSLLARAKELKESHGVEKVSFAVVIKDGKVKVQAKAKGE